MTTPGSALNGATALVVGGQGFIGSHLVRRLLELGASVVSLSLHQGCEGNGGSGNLTQTQADIRDKAVLESKLRGHHFDFVINAAGYIDHRPYAKGGRDLINQHYLGTLNLIDCIWTPDLRCYCHLGSSDEYGLAPAPQREDTREDPIAPYSAAKVAATHFIQMVSRTEGFPGVVLRPFLVYGPGQDRGRFLPQVIDGCLQDREFPVSEGKQVRDFCFVDDVVSGIVLSLGAEAVKGAVLNLASGQPRTIREVIETVQAMIGAGRPRFGKVPMRANENPALYADVGRADKLLGWSPIVRFDQGLQYTIAAYAATRDVAS